MAKLDKLHVSAAKVRRTQNKEKITDLFTALCEADLHTQAVREYRFNPERRWRFDYALPEYKIALEVEGGVWTRGRHTRPQGFLGDIEKYNTATLMGWRVLRTTPDGLNTQRTLRMLRCAVRGVYAPNSDADVTKLPR